MRLDLGYRDADPTHKKAALESDLYHVRMSLGQIPGNPSALGRAERVAADIETGQKILICIADKPVMDPLTWVDLVTSPLDTQDNLNDPLPG